MSGMTFLGLPALSSSNVSLYAVPIMWILSFVPHEYKLLKLGTRYNNNKPRDPVTWRAGDSEDYKQGIEKLGAIHHNGMENFPLFGVAVLAGNVANLPIPYLNSFVLFYTLNRLAYDILYYTQESFFANSLRTGVFVSGMFSCLWMLVKSAATVHA